MITFFNKKYFFRILITIFITSVNSYSYAANDTVTPIFADCENTVSYSFNGESFVKKLPNSIIDYYKKDPMTFYIPGNELFSEPLQLLVLQDLLKAVIEILNEFEIDYWITDNTLYTQLTSKH